MHISPFTMHIFAHIHTQITDTIIRTKHNVMLKLNGKQML